MNAPESAIPNPVFNTSTPDLLGLFVRRGLAEFCRGLPEYQDLTQLLGDAPRNGLLDALSGDWPTFCQWLERRQNELPGAAGRFIHDFKLTLPEIFLLALLGEVESDHRVTLTIAELQAPGREPRPSQHLVSNLLTCLFPDGKAVHPLGHPLLKSGAIRLLGDEPLPLRHLALDERLWNLLRDQRPAWPGVTPLGHENSGMIPAEIRESLPRLADMIQSGRLDGLILRGDRDTGRLVAAQLAERLQQHAARVDIADWNDQPVVTLYFRYARWLPVFEPDLGPGDRLPFARATDAKQVAVFLLGRDGSIDHPGLAELTLPPLGQEERRAMLSRASAEDTQYPQDALHARLQGPALHATWKRAQQLARQQQESPTVQHWARARWMINPDRLRRLAEPMPRRIEPEAMILSPGLERELESLLQRCRHRETLWQGLGPTLQASCSPGVRCLFVGESGTGKTLAASYLATALAAPLFRVDLAGVVNKYIGETEKNLGALLDEAAESDIILLFDEADSVFGQRTDGGETGERYANMLTNFLLTRIEDHPGIIFLTSNARARIDPAFTRRLDVILEFPLPGYNERLRLWQSHLGERSPGDEICRQLASHCDLAGGYIRNTVLTAAARAQRITPLMLIDALTEEYHKLGQSLPVDLQQWRNGLTE